MLARNMFNTLMLDQFVQQDQERQERQRTAWERYCGEYPKQLRPLTSDPKAVDNVNPNYLRLIVDKVAALLFGFHLDFEVDGKRDTPEETWLREALEANHATRKLFQIAINGGVCGHVFIQIHEPDPVTNGHEFPRFTIWDPSCVSVRWDPHDYERVESYAYQWNATDPRPMQAKLRRRVVRRDGQQWVIQDEEGNGVPSGWQVESSVVWPYPWCPVLDCQNYPRPNEFWGTADLEPDVIALAESVNFCYSNIKRILRHHAHPKTWGSGAEAKELEFGPDNIIMFPAPDVNLHNLEMVSDLTSSLAYLKMKIETLFAMCRVPQVSSGKVEDLGALSGLAMQILYRPLVEQITAKRSTYGPLLQHLCQRFLEMGGFGEKHQIRPQWPAILPFDKRQEAETATFLMTLGVSRSTLISEMGYDPLAEEEKREQEPPVEAISATNPLGRNQPVNGAPVGAENRGVQGPQTFKTDSYNPNRDSGGR